ncbi:hypothetical protein [Nocardia sp. alder85J]|uniref:hypothetical protein n=1 Tax=Nocardia sp. alder85J TaxID=2862949 RepID=UPI001CD3048E|nr:hypothetical protein [Nocardia sp. alder85J]MCX4090925.1 hypothetical protein [Nocardia sp. alder85J]
MAPPPGPDSSFDFSGYSRQRPEPAGYDDGPVNSAMDRTIAQSIGNPPVHWLVLAAVCVAAGIAVAAGTGRSPVTIAAWALDGPVALSVLAIFTRADLQQRSRTLYNPRVYAMPLYALILTAAAGGVCWSAWLFANWLARR